MKKHLVTWSILLVLVAVVWSDFNVKIWKSPDRVIQWDVIDYYGYLPAAFIYHDITLRFKDHYSGDKKFVFWAKKTATGKYVFKMTMGVSVMVSPFFFAANALAGPLGYNTGGYSLPYRFALVMAGLFYLILGLIFLAKVLRLYFSETVTAFVLVSIALGTNLFWYSTFEPGMSHVYTFFLASVFLWLTILWHKNPRTGKAILLGLVTGLLALIRPINILFIIFFIFYDVKSLPDIRKKCLLFRNKALHLLIMAGFGILVLLPQLVYWKTVSGHWIYYSYGNEGFFFNHPQWLRVLFSFRKGWFVYTPVMIFAVTGIGFLFKKLKPFSVATLLLLFIYLYVVSSWWCWWYGGSLGQRELIDIYPVMAIPLAAMIEWTGRLMKPKRYILGTMIALSVLLGAFYNVQYHYGAIHWDSMTRAAWVNSFGRLHPSPQFNRLIQAPDYEKALSGLPETPDKVPEEQQINQIINRIKKDTTWYEMVKEKARKKDISIDSMLYLDARYCLEHQK
jgi:hypothetical protein